MQNVENVRDALAHEEPYQELIAIEDLGLNTYCASSSGLARA